MLIMNCETCFGGRNPLMFLKLLLFHKMAEIRQRYNNVSVLRVKHWDVVFWYNKG